ncbi:hypothetical protein [Natronobeatus ordinarius]|uniref:hypothetical protein n=1 Tax=Natronobeatus ordinarius TaxID=2963433 RepID=UPI0020CEB97E|nr:hypothetical protein [Natronobeatus ordinarius]
MIGTNTRPVPKTPPAGEWELPEEGLEITLPSGATFEHEIHDGHERRHGWEQVKELPGIDSVDDVGEVVRAPNAIEEDGQYDLIIGDNPTGDGQVVLRLVKGMVISAAEVVEDPLGNKIEIDRTDEHPVRDDGDHIPNYDIVRDVIANPNQIWQNGPHYVYAKHIDGQWYTVRVYEHPDGLRTISTTVIYEDRSQFEKFLDRKGYPSDPLYESD